MTRQSEGNVIMVVDDYPDDYQRLVAAGKASGIRFTFLKTAEEALRSHPGPSVLAWMINMQLRCMTGLELFELLRPRLAHIPVLMVDDEYDAAREFCVLEMGRLHYLCKPLGPLWLTGREDVLRNPMNGHRTSDGYLDGEI